VLSDKLKLLSLSISIALDEMLPLVVAVHAHLERVDHAVRVLTGGGGGGSAEA
jgi:hypothetical protein